MDFYFLRSMVVVMVFIDFQGKGKVKWPADLRNFCLT
jgi:hypothetical protein